MIRLNHGLLVVVEGIDGAGKTTQVEMLRARLAEQGLDVVTSKEPTDGPWGRKIRASASTGRMALADELHAFIEDRREHVANLVLPALRRGAVVIVDRYYYSTAAYQGVRGADPGAVVQANEEFAPRPHVLILLDVPPAVGLGRVQRRDGEGNEFERIENLDACAVVFRAHATAWNAVVVDGQRGVQDVHRDITDAVVSQMVDHLHPSDLWMAGRAETESAAARAVRELAT